MRKFWAEHELAHQADAHGLALLGDPAGDSFKHFPDALPQNQGPGGGIQISEPSDVIPGNTSTSFTLALGGVETGVVNVGGDDDWFRVTLTAGQSYVFTLTGDANPSGLQDSFLELRDSGGNLLAVDDDGAATGFNSLLRYTATQSGTYYINARAWEPDAPDAPTITGGYTITFNTGPAQNPLNTIIWGAQLPSSTIDVYFATTGENYGSQTATRSWAPNEIAAAMSALATWSAVIPVTFQQTLNAADAEFHLVLADLGTGLLGQMSPTTGNAAFNPNGAGWTTAGLLPGGDGFVTLVHEFGHGVGLAHPHDNGGNSEVMQGVLSEFGSYGTFLLNQGVFTTMSYNDGWALAPFGANSSTTSGGQASPMALDIAAAQQIYGINSNTGVGDTTYTLAPTSSAYIAIWDTGGTDTISFAGGSANATIDLRAATLLNEVGGGGFVSFASGVFGGYTIAHNVVIENATGGNGNDTINGNSANNVLIGNQGQDTISGGDGNDTITGGVANDTLSGGLGFDTANYAAASTAATWTRHVDGSWTVATTGTFEGNDTVTSVEYLHFADRDVHLANAWQTFSGDGTSDILLRHSSGALGMWFVNGGSATGAGVANIDPAWTIVGSADFDGDGRDDLFMRHSSGSLGVWFMNGATAVGAAGIGSLDSSWSVGGLGDFNGDTKDDILLWNANGSLGLWLMNGAVATGSAIGSISQSTFDIAGIGDLNGDGRDDILWRNTGTGDVGVWFMNGAAATGAGIGNIPLSWAIEGLGDFNGDGRDDILLRDASGNLGIWFMNGASATGAGVGNIDHTWSVAGVGDYNGDGKDDILWWNDNGSLGIWFMNGAAATGAVSLGAVTHDWIINPGG